MGVTVTINRGTPYTWASAGFVWASPDTGQPWQTFSPTGYQIAVAEAWLTLEARSSALTKALAEAWQTAEGATHGAYSGTTVVGLYLPGGKVNLLQGLPALVTSNNYTAGGSNGFNYMGGHNWFATNGISSSGIVGGKVTFADGTSGTITAASDGSGSTESAYLYYTPSASGPARFLLNKAIREAWATAETYAEFAQYHLRIMEAWATGEVLAKVLPKLAFAEGFHVAESAARTLAKAISEAWSTHEDFSRLVGFLRAFSEGWATAEKYATGYGLNKAEALALFEFYKRHANGVVSDIILSASDMELQDFINAVEYGRAPGFSAFRDFATGDYLYQSAVFRAVMEAEASDRGVIDALQVQVDVPDVFDGGEVAVTNAGAGAAVTFSRTFNIVPDLTFSLKAGATLAAVPTLVGNPTKTGFTIKLQDANGVAYTGSFTWAARGY